MKRFNKLFLFLLVLVVLSASTVSSITIVVVHDCCTVEEYCYPCLLADKLRNTFRYGIVVENSAIFTMSVIFVLAVFFVVKNHPTNNLVELKVRMNN